MIRVNLLSERKQEKKQQKQKKADVVSAPIAISGLESKKISPMVLTLVLVVGAAALVMALAYFLLKMNVESLKDEYKANTAKMADIKQKIEEVKKYEVLNNAIKAKKTLIETLKGNQILPAKLLDEVSKLMPGDLWITSMSFNNPQFSIDGVAFTNNDIVAFVENLKRSPNVVEVYLAETRQGNIDKTEVYFFKLNFKART